MDFFTVVIDDSIFAWYAMTQRGRGLHLWTAKCSKVDPRRGGQGDGGRAQGGCDDGVRRAHATHWGGDGPGGIDRSADDRGVPHHGVHRLGGGRGHVTVRGRICSQNTRG